MSRELNCTWRCTNPKHKLTQRRFHIPQNGAPLCPICRQPMIPARNITYYRATSGMDEVRFVVSEIKRLIDNQISLFASWICELVQPCWDSLTG